MQTNNKKNQDEKKNLNKICLRNLAINDSLNQAIENGIHAWNADAHQTWNQKKGTDKE